MKSRLSLSAFLTAATLALASCTTPGEQEASLQVGNTSNRVGSLLEQPLNSIPTICNSCHSDHQTAKAKLSQRISNPFPGLTPLQDATLTINARLELGQQCFINKIGASNIASLQHFAGPTNASGQLGAFRAQLKDGQPIDALMMAQPIPGTNQAILSMVFPRGEFDNCTI